jgi:signal transduction histidine kinase
LAPQPTKLNDVLNGMEKLLQTALAGTADLDMRLDPRPEPVLVDPQQIEQAILNLVTNARDATPDGGRVTITTTVEEVVTREAMPDLPPGRYAVLAVADTGVGMQEDVRVRAIEPFFTTKEVGKGSGFGLSQVHGLVHQSGGTMIIDSAPGKGTTVRLYLPVDRTSSGDNRLTLLSAQSSSWRE